MLLVGVCVCVCTLVYTIHHFQGRSALKSSSVERMTKLEGGWLPVECRLMDPHLCRTMIVLHGCLGMTTTDLENDPSFPTPPPPLLYVLLTPTVYSHSPHFETITPNASEDATPIFSQPSHVNNARHDKNHYSFYCPH